MMAKGLAWLEGMEAWLTVEVTLGMLSQRYTVVMHFLTSENGKKIDTEGAEEVRRTRRHREDLKIEI